jgi:MoaA/NifB/PqqE/SkfB family radical SAM enzyme
MRRYIDGHVTRVPEPPNMVQLNYDTTCNLACPSCRTEMMVARNEEQDLYTQAKERFILPLLRSVSGEVYVSRGGEPFASKHYRSILRELNRTEYPHLELSLVTNGLLLTPERWLEFPNMAEMLRTVSVSIDAAQAETYENVRRPGKWLTLVKNLEFIADLRRSGKIPHLSISFVIQKDNYLEMPEFLDLAERLGVDEVFFQRVVNFGTYGEAQFAAVDVGSRDHSEHGQFLEVLKNRRFKSPKIKFSLLSPELNGLVG